MRRESDIASLETQPLVNDAADWRHVLDRFLSDCPASEKAVQLLTKFDGNLTSFLAPICAAWSVAQDDRLLNKKEPLRIAILGAESGDSGLDGRLYSLIPWFLGRPNITIEVELIGPNLKPKSRARGLDAIGLPSAAMHRMTCGQWFKKRKAPLPDILLAFHPGLEGHADEWMASNELPTILAMGIPLVVFSYDLDEAERDAAILNGFGANITDPPHAFPLAVSSYTNDPHSPPITFASATFSVAGFKAQPVDPTLIEGISTLSKAIANVHQNEGIVERHADAFRPCWVFRGDELRIVMHVFGRIYFDFDRHELFIAFHGHEVSGRTPDPAGRLVEKLSATKSPLDRARLAAFLYDAVTGGSTE